MTEPLKAPSAPAPIPDRGPSASADGSGPAPFRRPLQFEIHLNRAWYVSELVEGVFTDSVAAFAEDLLSEASRLEAAIRVTRIRPQITPTMVRQANNLLRFGHTEANRSRWKVVFGILALVGSLIMGVSLEYLGEPSGQLAFAISVGATAVFGILVHTHR